MLHAMNADQKIKKYVKVAITLTVITFVELAVVKFHFLPAVLITLLVVGLSLFKAYTVAWHFMHLNHERGWTRAVALLPLGMVVYAGVLLADQKFRPISDYVGEPDRVAHGTFEAEHSTKHEENKEAHAGATEDPMIETAGEVHTSEPTANQESHDVAPSPEKSPEKTPEASGSGGSGADSQWK